MKSEMLGQEDARSDRQHDALVKVGRYLRNMGYEFTAITPASHARVNLRPGNDIARDLRDVFGWSRRFGEGILPDALFSPMREAGLLEPSYGDWISRVRFSTLDNQLFVHSAFPTTGDDAVFFGPDTYKFVDAIKQLLAEVGSTPRAVADVCSGAGPGAMVIAKALPQAHVLSVDINPQALRLAAVNAQLNGTPNVEPRDSNLLSNVEGELDLIVAHPPYLVDRNRRAYRHGGGVLGADLPLAVIKSGMARLSPRGHLLLFTGVALQQGCDAFYEEAAEMLGTAGAEWCYREVDADVFGEELDYAPYENVDRIALKVLTVTRPGT